MESASPLHMTCVLKLDTQTPGWQKSMTKVLMGIKDVTYTIDAPRGLAYVTGKINPDVVLKVIAKADKHAEVVRVDYGYNLPERTTGNIGLYELHPQQPCWYPHYQPMSTTYQPVSSSYSYPHYAPAGQYYPGQSSYYAPAGQRFPRPPYYASEAQYFPQPPSQPADFNVGEPQCSIM